MKPSPRFRSTAGRTGVTLTQNVQRVDPIQQGASGTPLLEPPSAAIEETRWQILAANVAALLLTGLARLPDVSPHRQRRFRRSNARSRPSRPGITRSPFRLPRPLTKPAASPDRSRCSSRAPRRSTSSAGSNPAPRRSSASSRARIPWRNSASACFRGSCPCWAAVSRRSTCSRRRRAGSDEPPPTVWRRRRSRRHVRPGRGTGRPVRSGPHAGHARPVCRRTISASRRASGPQRRCRSFASPLLSKDTLLGVVEVATFRSFDSRQQALLDELMPLVAMSLEVLQRNLRTQELLGQTRAQAAQLRAAHCVKPSSSSAACSSSRRTG